MWPGLQTTHQLLFASALSQGSAGIFCYASFLPYFLLGNIQGMLLSDTSEKLKKAIFPHACCNGKILKNFPQVTYDIYL